MRYLVKLGFMGYAISFISIGRINDSMVVTLVEFYNENK